MNNLLLTTRLLLTTLTTMAQELTVGTYNLRNRNDYLPNL